MRRKRLNWCYVSKWLELLHRSILTVKSLKRTLYSLPKTTLILPYTPLHDVNVTSIYNNTRTHILIFLYKTNLPFDLYLEEGRNRCIFLPPYSSFRSKINIYSKHSLLEKSLVCHFIDHLLLIIWRLMLLCSSITFSSMCIVII